MIKPTTRFVEFANAPVVEVVCGVGFRDIPIEVTQVGLLWLEFADEFALPPREHPLPLRVPEQNRGVLDSAAFIAITKGIAKFPIPRVVFRREDETRLVQFERDRFYFNWQKTPTEPYPHFDAVYPAFEVQELKFRQAVKSVVDHDAVPLWYELTYLNLIEKDSIWQDFSQLGAILRDFNWDPSEERVLRRPIGINWNTEFELPAEAGRLHIAIRSVRKLESGTEALQVELTARSPDFSEIGAPPARDSWFGVAHEQIVRGFADITTDRIQREIWKRRV